MNKIRLQDLTPNIYYDQSRDFQFIGRLFDIVLNAVKTNTESLYNLPLNDNTDEKLLDLIALTLGFKSKHNYNIHQLTSLCGAFTTVIKNKGNINSIIIAINALLNAEGIAGTADYNFEDNYKVLNLFIPQTLSDTNLLKDLLIYILPAGISCNIIKEFRETTVASTELFSNDELTIYEGTYSNDGNSILIPTNTNAKSTIIKPDDFNYTDAFAKSTPGLLANTGIYQPITTSGSDLTLQYNITYVTDGGKIKNTVNTKYSYKFGAVTNLPTEVTKDGYIFTGWYATATGGIPILKIEATESGNKVFYAHYTKETK